MIKCQTATFYSVMCYIKGPQWKNPLGCLRRGFLMLLLTVAQSLVTFKTSFVCPTVAGLKMSR